MQPLGTGAPGRFSTEVKRSEASHEGEKCPGAPDRVIRQRAVG